MELFGSGSDAPDDEPLELNGLDRWRIFRELTETADERRRALLRTVGYWRARQLLPPGPAGSEQFDRYLARIEPLLDLLGPAVPESFRVELELVPPIAGGSGAPGDAGSVRAVELLGELELFRDREGRFCRLHHREETKGRHLLDFWLDHLLLTLTEREPLTIHGPAGSLCFRPTEPETARRRLFDLAELYAAAHGAPPTLLPGAGWDYLRKLRTGDDQAAERALRSALTPGFLSGHLADFPDDVRWILGGRRGDEILELLGSEAVRDTACRIFGPLYDSLADTGPGSDDDR